MRTRTLLLLTITLTVVPILGAVVVPGVAADGAARFEGPVRRAAAPSPSARPTVLSASEVLRAWDRRRARAWARAEPGPLARLYTPRSRTGARDVADLRRWRGRGLRVVGLRQQVAELRVRDARSRTLVLWVTDRTVGGIAVDRHRRTALPVSAWVTHRIRLCRSHGRWQVDEVVAQPAR